MLNQIVLVGRLVEKPILEEAEDNKYATITLAVPRSFKNTDGEYETDFVDVIVNGTIAITTVEYCDKGDLVGIKGRIQTTTLGDTRKNDIIAEKVTFLSSNKKED